MNRALITLAAALSLTLAGGMRAPAFAGVTPEEAARLKTVLMPLGGERAGNQDGSIPAWTGGLTAMPSGWKPTEPRPDFFAHENPVLTITADTIDKYKDMLPVGVVEMFKRHPDYRVEVWPTHRTAAAPQWVYDNTFTNATRASTVNDGLSLEGAYGGIPFPIPHTGREAMWNHALRWRGEATLVKGSSYVELADGQPQYLVKVNFFHQYPYYDKEGSLETFAGVSDIFVTQPEDPPNKVGQSTLVYVPVDQDNVELKSWMYLPGEKRVRRVPNFSFDTPNGFEMGVGQFDEVEGFFGPFDRYDFKLVGKQEMYVPYNQTKMMRTDPAAVLAGHFINPDVLRWERHRVWVVDAVLAPGKFNVVTHRRLYLDEDSWIILAVDEWDGSDHFWREILSIDTPAPDIPAVVEVSSVCIDLHMDAMAVNLLQSSGGLGFQAVPKLSRDLLTPEHLATGIIH